MDISYIRKNMNKQSSHDLMNMLKDLVIKADIKIINNFSIYKQYTYGDKVYIKEGNKHKVYICMVEKSTKGKILDSEWNYYLEKEKVQKKYFNPLEIYEENLVVDTNGLFEYPLQYNQYKAINTTVAAFNSVQPRLRYGIDFVISNKGIVKFLTPMNIGEKVILEIRHLNGIVFNNLYREIYVEENYLAYKNTRIVPIRYHGYRNSSKLEIFDMDGNLLEEGLDYQLNDRYIILTSYLKPGERLNITMWNKVLITPTSPEYIYDEDNNIYKLGVNDNAQLVLSEADDMKITSNYIELISQDGTLYHCIPSSDKQLLLHPKEPDIILADNNKYYILSINNEKKLYLKEIEDVSYYKNIHIISLENELYKIISTNGELDVEKVIDDNILNKSLNYKHIYSDDGKLYKIELSKNEFIIQEDIIDYEKQKPIKYINLVSPNGTNFIFFATDDAKLAVRPYYNIDNNSNIIIGDDGYFYLLGMTNDGELYTTKLKSSNIAAKNKRITDENNNLYEIHVDEYGSVYIQYINKTTDEKEPIILYSDAADKYELTVDDSYLISGPIEKSTILKDIRSGYLFKLFIENNSIKIERVLTENYEKKCLRLVENHHVYELYLYNREIKIRDLNIDLPEKETVYIDIYDKSNENKYKIYLREGKLVIE